MHFVPNWTALIANLLLIQLLGAQHATAAAIEGRGTGTTRYSIPTLKSRPNATRTPLLTGTPVFAIYSAPPESHTSYALCEVGKCVAGDACSVQGPLSRSLTASPSSINCAKFSTRTTDTLPTASYATIGSDPAVHARPTTISNKKSSLQDRDWDTNRTLDRRQETLQHGIEDFGYASELSQRVSDHGLWLSQAHNVTSQWYEFPVSGDETVGVNGLYGCTVIVIASMRGVFLAHLFEIQVFQTVDVDYFETSTDTVFWDYVRLLDKGTQGVQGIAELVGTKERPGPLNAIYAPRVFAIGPRSTQLDRDLGEEGYMKYEERTFDIVYYLMDLIPGSLGGVLSYNRIPWDSPKTDASTPFGFIGRVILEFTSADSWLEGLGDPANEGRPVQGWRLWVQGELVSLYEFVAPWFEFLSASTFEKRGMGVIGESPCPDEC